MKYSQPLVLPPPVNNKKATLTIIPKHIAEDPPAAIFRTILFFGSFKIKVAPKIQPIVKAANNRDRHQSKLE